VDRQLVPLKAWEHKEKEKKSSERGSLKERKGEKKGGRGWLPLHQLAFWSANERGEREKKKYKKKWQRHASGEKGGEREAKESRPPGSNHIIHGFITERNWRRELRGSPTKHSTKRRERENLRQTVLISTLSYLYLQLLVTSKKGGGGNPRIGQLCKEENKGRGEGEKGGGERPGRGTDLIDSHFIF